ncbi:uncharacterized protein CTRU02_215486 [Colletotrichum truncatum]|uniref:Uncharacterized protein n=1 Tax=Colletotrichum truncatum TaxID=5467 RepID=A0ACC3YCK7_COLTU|nr:uncharacterized protein CTRU02_05570 [Colletotrichum truncatum]KAF6794013.1 hypothetical protein CTRU02_05570 [Colletotrichum truncatum]
MEDLNLDWSFDCASDSATAERYNHVADHPTLVAQQADQPSNDDVLSLLRLSDWDRNKEYNKTNLECIQYDLMWKVSKCQNIRAQCAFQDTDPDLVLAPSDLWSDSLEAQVRAILNDDKTFPGDLYVCEKTIINISISSSRQRGLKKSFKGLDIDWKLVDSHMEGLSDLLIKRKKITLSIEFIYREVTSESTTVKGKNKARSATAKQKLQRDAEAGLWARIYEKYRCRGENCRKGPHCWPDGRGYHHALLPKHLEPIAEYIKGTMKEGETEEDVNIDVEIPSRILGEVLSDSRKRKAEDSADCRSCKAYGRHRDAGWDLGDVVGDRKEKLEEYCSWSLQQVENDEWRAALQVAITWSLHEYLDLNTIKQHPKDTAALMVAGGVKAGIAWQFVSNVRVFQQETRKS